MGDPGLLVAGARRDLATCCQELHLQVSSELQPRAAKNGCAWEGIQGRERGTKSKREERGLKGVQSCMRDWDMVGGVALGCERVRGAR